MDNADARTLAGLLRSAQQQIADAALNDDALVRIMVRQDEHCRKLEEALVELQASVKPYGIGTDSMGACLRYAHAMEAANAVLP